ncbi:MAG: hypothetical protein IPG45_19335 [Deltaproteobacteria bacterium]|nr:hypothetical protein [Deltaproteobacteria bacterium]
MIGVALLLGLIAAPVHRSALIVGVNEAFEDSQATLHYADDDAARYYELLSPSLDQVRVLTVLDADSQALYPAVAQAARPPNLATWSESLLTLEQAALAARAQGQRTELYLIYVGHGRAPGGEGEVRLLGGSLGRRTLGDRLGEARGFDRIHLVVDACNAYHLVHERGPEAAAIDFEQAFERFVDTNTLAQDPRLGVVLATRGAGNTPEWSRYQAGVFSHGVRSALVGAADADGNGAIDYLELEAFLAAAHLKIPEPKGRPKIFVKAPAIEVASEFWRPDLKLPILELLNAPAEPCFLEDDRGVRYADFHAAPGLTLRLSLVPRGNYGLYTQAGGALARVEGPTGVTRLVGPFTARTLARLWRGEDEPPGAFEVAYGPDFVAGFRAQRSLEEAKPEVAPGPSVPLILGLSAAGVAVALGGGTVWQGTRADEAYERYRSAQDQDPRDQAAGDMETAQGWALGLGISAAALALVSAGLLTWDFLD